MRYNYLHMDPWSADKKEKKSGQETPLYMPVRQFRGREKYPSETTVYVFISV